ncbi:MAG: hypothetical protein PVI66_02880 [Candidatus Aminicenantes bacterium]|jgi:hypothetical protein
MSNSGKDELLTSRYRCKGKAVASEAVVNYREEATTKALEGDRFA